MNTYLLEYHYYQGMHTYCNRGEEKDFPPVEWATKRGRKNVKADTLFEAQQKLIDWVWNNRLDDRYSETQWAVTRDKIHVQEVYKTI